MNRFYLFILFCIVLSKTSFAQRNGLINSGELIKKAITFHDSSKYKSALTLLNQVNRSDTNYVWAVYEKAVNCEADSQYNQAIKYCEEGLKLKEQRDYEPDLYNTYGNTLNDMGQPEKAIKVFDAAIAKYPAYSLLYFNKGIALLGLKRSAEAETLFQKTLLINPYMYSAHFQLGLAALQQGKIIPSFLSFTGYLLINPSGKYMSRSIGFLDKITKGTDDILELKKNRTSTQDEAYQEVEEILLSKIALDKSYKPLISLDDPISRQIQAVFEKLEYQKNSDDFWVQYYLPYYKQIYSQGKLEPFIFHSFSNVKLAVINEYNKKNKKVLEDFVNEAAVYFDQIRITRELNFTKRDSVKEKYFFENGKLLGKGRTINNGKTLTGHWDLCYSEGNKKATGNYSQAGEREGNWTYYFYSGNLKAKEYYKAGKLNGLQEYYFENGNLSSQENYINGVAEGLVNTYYVGGKMKSSVKYTQGKKAGEERQFHSNGSLQLINHYVNGTVTGLSTEYFKSGKVKGTSQYNDGKSDGAYKSYYENGNLSTEGIFSKDKAEGEWKFYYESGKIKEKRHYINDFEEGIHEEYYDTGELFGRYATKKGKIDGESIYYYKDGKIFSKYVYVDGIVKAATYNNAEGRQISGSGIKNNTLDIVSYNTEGFKKSHANFNEKGQLNGPDTIFYPSGKINQINEYKNDELNGLSVTYYLNGKIKTEINMTDGKDNGYLTSFYANGKPESEGWMQDGQHQGEWLFYNEGGKLNVKSYYLNDDLNGYKETYDPNGKKNLEEKYHLGWLEKLTQYDSTEKVIAVDTFAKASGKYTLVYPNGQIMVQGNYVTGDFDGPYKTYYFDGSPESSYYYKKGLLDSTYVSYYFGGQKNTEGIFNYGNKAGLWKRYDEDGKLSSTTNYAEDQANGEKIYYFETGGKDYVGEYKDDELEGATKKYDPDGTLAYQINFKNGNAISYSYVGSDGKLVAPVSLPYTNALLKTYFPNGKLSRECKYSDGVKNGGDIIYYSNGKVRSEDVPVYGIAEGLSKEYYSNGKLKSDYYYINDSPDGVCKDFYEKGNVKKEMFFENGISHGATRYFNENGKLVKTMQYYYGKLLSVKNE